MQLENYILSDADLVRTSGTSDGTQDKYYKDGVWFKIDRYGGEGIAEYTASEILKACDYPEDKYVHYTPCLVNGKPGCYSKNFLKTPSESFITLYRLYYNTNNRDLSQVCASMDYDDAINYVIRFVELHTGLDIREYLADTFALDYLILNEDRHFNNLGIIFDGQSYRTAPIFDNGKSFLIGNSRIDTAKDDTIENKIQHAYAKAFSPSFALNYEYLKKFGTLSLSQNIIDVISNTDAITEDIKQIINHQLSKIKR